MDHQSVSADEVMHLVTDEEFDLPSRAVAGASLWAQSYSNKIPFRFRVRVWRGKDRPAVVVVSQVMGGAPPCWASSKIANYVNQVYLRWPKDGIMLYEVEREADVWAMEFTVIGPRGLRSHMIEPRRLRSAWHFIQEIIGDTTAQP